MPRDGGHGRDADPWEQLPDDVIVAWLLPHIAPDDRAWRSLLETSRRMRALALAPSLPVWHAFDKRRLGAMAGREAAFLRRHGGPCSFISSRPRSPRAENLLTADISSLRAAHLRSLDLRGFTMGVEPTIALLARTPRLEAFRCSAGVELSVDLLLTLAACVPWVGGRGGGGRGCPCLLCLSVACAADSPPSACPPSLFFQQHAR